MIHIFIGETGCTNVPSGRFIELQVIGFDMIANAFGEIGYNHG